MVGRGLHGSHVRVRGRGRNRRRGRRAHHRHKPPRKAGQAFVDGLRRRLDAEIKEYAEKIRTSSNVEALLAQKCGRGRAAYNAEMSRVSALLMDALRSVAEKWLRGNKRGVTVIVPANEALAASPGADVSDELRRLLDKISINFTKK